MRRAGGMDEEDDEMADGDDGHALGDMAAQAASRAHDFDAAATDRAQRTAAAGAPEGTGARGGEGRLVGCDTASAVHHFLC